MNKRWNGHVEVHEEATNLIGYHGDKRTDKAEIIIRREYISSASNDIGFKLAQDGTYQAIISDYDSSTHNQKWLDKLSQTYAEETIREVANEFGYDMDSVKQGEEIFITCTGGMF